jgi:hypothetical protein
VTNTPETTTKETTMPLPTILVGDIVYQPVPTPAETRIVVLQRGWVVVGRWQQDGEMVTLTEAKVIRRWGTTKGLGELTGGPTAATVVDPAGTVRFHLLTMVQSVDCEPGSWR